MKIVEELIVRWESQDIELLAKSSISEIEAAFATVGAKATADVVELYSQIGGMVGMEYDACWRLWSLTEIVEENKVPSAYGTLFSDHLICSWCYRLKYETDGRSSVYIDYFDTKQQPKKLFDGLEEFFKSYAKDPKSIIG